MQNPAVSTFFSAVDPKSLWILDIDSSLVLTHKRNEAILQRFADEFGSQYPAFCKKLKQTQCFAFEYGYQAALVRAGVTDQEEECASLATYWREHFFSGTFLHHDIVHEDAIKFVATLRKNNLPFVYLTGRHKPTMYDGTLKELTDLGFPVTPDKLFLKPRPADKDELYKTWQTSEFKKTHKKMIFLDNEPKVLNQIERDHPEIPMIFIDTCHSPNVTPPSKALRLKGFRDLISFIEN